MPLIHSSEKKEQAILLRKNGQGLRSVAKQLSISLSTAQLWTKEVILSKEQKQHIAIEHRKKLMLGQRKFIEQRKAQKVEKELQTFTKAKKEIRDKKSDAFFMIGLALYWAEGFKKDHSLGFVNSDPVMIQIFLKWLKTYGEISSRNIRLRLQIHDVYRASTESTQLYWSHLLHVPVSQFQAPFYQLSKFRPTSIDPTYRGLLRVRVIESRELFIKILGWLEGLKSIDGLK